MAVLDGRESAEGIVGPVFVVVDQEPPSGLADIFEAGEQILVEHFFAVSPIEPFSERYTLSLLKRQGLSCRSIARILDRAPSTISRELRRNACHTTNGAYRPSKAQERTNGRRRRSRRVKHHSAGVYEEVETLLREVQWSPEQIANWLALNGVASISHMTIYRYVREDSRRGKVNQ